MLGGEDQSKVNKVVYGHRGAPVELPENTLEGFARAFEVGADALETDVHLTSDGQVVVAHDDTGERCCRVPRRIDATPLAELRRWNAGETHPHARASFRIPTLAEALEAFPEAFFNIDVKPRALAAVTQVVRVVNAQRAAERVRLTSFHSSNVRLARGLGFANTGLGLSEIVLLRALPLAVLQRLRRGGTQGSAAQVPTHQGALRLDGAEFIEKCHRLGLRVDYWTIDRPQEAARLFALGADGVVTNDPRSIVPEARAQDAVAERRQRPGPTSQ